MATPLTGLFLGAGASYEIGMPLVWELTQEINGWLTADKLRELNADWRRQRTPFPNEVIENIAPILGRPDLHYEAVLGYVETQIRRSNGSLRQGYSGFYAWLVYVVYGILYLRHINNEALIDRMLPSYDGLATLAARNQPLWIFSLNHDLIVELIAAQHKVPINSGYSGTVTLPRRDPEGKEIGRLKAETISEAELDKGLPFWMAGTAGINLLKIHGALDVFTYNDGKDMLKILPAEQTPAAIIAALRQTNTELLYAMKGAPGGRVHATNEITYADDAGEMQFLRRSLLAGAFKFDSRHHQVLPHRMLEHFKTNLRYVTHLICIGYGFGDLHINAIVRDWLEVSANRSIKIVGPGTRQIPAFLLHLAPQVHLVDAPATNYLDEAAGITRDRHYLIQRRLSMYLRGHPDRQKAFRTYMTVRMGTMKQRVLAKIGALPRNNGKLDIEGIGTGPEALMKSWVDEGKDHPDDAAEAFLDEQGAPR